MQDIFDLLLTPPGDLYYHLALLFTLQIFLSVAWGYRVRSGRSAEANRLLWAASGMLLGRVALVIASAVVGSGVLPAAALLPPLERFVDLTLIALAAWAFLSLFRHHRRLALALLTTVLLLAALTYVYFAATWPAAEANGFQYNTYWQSTAWDIASLLLAVAATLLLFFWPRPGQWLVAAALLAWTAGHLLQMLLVSTAPHLAGVARLANLVALPLLTAQAFQEALQHGPSPTPRVRANALAQPIALTQRVESATDLEAGLAAAIPDIAAYLGASTAAVGLPTTGAIPAIRIVASFPANNPPSYPLLLKSHTLLDAAANTRQPQQTDAATDHEAAFLLRRLGVREPGPLLVEPLANDQELVGMLLLGNPAGRETFSALQYEKANVIAQLLAAVLTRAARQRRTTRESQEMAASLREQDTIQAQRLTTLAQELDQARQETQEFARRATEFERMAERQRIRADELAELLHIREEEAREISTATPTAIYEEEIRQLTESRDAVQAELIQWKEHAQTLEAQIQQAQRQPSAPVPSKTQPASLSGILIADSRGNIILADPEAQRLTGRPASDLLGAPLYSAFSDPLWAQAVGQLIGETDPETNNSCTLRQNEQLIHVGLYRTTNGTDQPGNYVALLRSESWPDNHVEVITSLTQELRTPMTSIVGYTDLLLGESVGILGEGQRKFVQRIKANVERLNSLMNDLIGIMVIDAGRIELTAESVDITRVIEEVIMGLSTQFRERDLTVRLDMALELPPIQADRDSLYQIMLHLLSNACQCSRPGSQVLVSSLREESVEEGLIPNLVISIADTGGGIAPEDMPRVFQRFYRADNPLIAGLGDTGVGLAIAKALVEAHGGRIWVESVVDVGSTFRFILPLARKGVEIAGDG